MLDLVDLEKQGRPGHVRGYLRVQQFPHDQALCPVAALVVYCNKVSTLSPDRNSLFVSFCKPHACVSPKTLARWTISMLDLAGVDTSIWKSHACRSASALHHRTSRQLSCIEIHKLADWSLAGNIFKKFYERYL